MYARWNYGSEGMKAQVVVLDGDGGDEGRVTVMMDGRG